MRLGREPDCTAGIADTTSGASATPALNPTSFGPVTVVTGTATCRGMDWNWTADPDGTQHVRDGHSPNGCTVVTNDPRVSGHRTSTWNMDLWANPTTGTGALVEWGTPRLENAVRGAGRAREGASPAPGVAWNAARIRRRTSEVRKRRCRASWRRLSSHPTRLGLHTSGRADDPAPHLVPRGRRPWR